MRWLIPGRLKSANFKVEDNTDYIGQLLMPRTWHLNQIKQYELLWAGDNDCFGNKFNEVKYFDWLNKAKPYQDKCLFINCPDVVCDPYLTGKLFKEFNPKVKALGYKTALVLQNGIENLEIDWDSLDAVFVGGSTDWKLSKEVIGLLKEAKSRGKWRHVGRVNSIERISNFWGFAESFDGTDYCYHPAECVRQYLPHLRGRKLQTFFDFYI